MTDRQDEPELDTLEIFRTETNAHNLFRIYHHRKPSQIPDAFTTTNDVADAPTFESANPKANIEKVFGPASSDNTTLPYSPDSSENKRSYNPFQNFSTFGLVNWGYNFSTTSAAALDSLVHDVIRHEEFSVDDLSDFRAKKEYKRLDQFKTRNITDSSSTDDNPFPASSSNNWAKDKIHVSMPCSGRSWESEDEAPKLSLDVWHRSLIEIIRSSCKSPIFDQFHLKAFKQFWKPDPEKPSMCVYGEAYASDRAHELEQQVYKSLPEPLTGEEDVENVVIWIMAWSDSTHLAQFGTASLWPIYVYIGNLSKYIRCNRSAFAANHLAYIPSLPDVIGSDYHKKFGQAPSAEVTRFLKREIMQAVWKLLMDTDFIHAHQHGFLEKCADSKIRRFFPRFFTYSADYMDRILLICMKFIAQCFCPGCLAKKSDWVQLTTSKCGYLVNVMIRYTTKQSMAVKGILDIESLTPIQNAWSLRLYEYGFDHFLMHPSDMLHMWSVGKEKDIFAASVRLLYTCSDDLVTEMDQRFRQVPTFGKRVVRKFRNNVSAMKKLAGRDYNNITICAMPCIEELFINVGMEELMQELFFVSATWYSFADLRLHTDSTLEFFKSTTTNLGHILRQFTKQANKHPMVELPEEAASRHRRNPKQNVSTPKSKKFSNSTPKTHFLGDFVRSIKYFGTTDSYDTSIGENQHQQVKGYYERTNKQDHEAQIACHDHRTMLLHDIRERNRLHSTRKQIALTESHNEPLPYTDPEAKYHMAFGKQFFLDLNDLEYDKDIALKDFERELKIYVFESMFQSDENSIHPFIYGRVIGIFHCNVQLKKTARFKAIRHHRVDFLWVRWYQYDSNYPSGWQAKRLHRLSFVDSKDPSAFGFIHPTDVLRGVHIVPAFHFGRTQRYLSSTSIARQYEAITPDGSCKIETNDWKFYYVNIFSDCDMTMLFLGGGIGHQHLFEHLTRFAEDAKINEQVLPCYNEDSDEIDQFIDSSEEGSNNDSDDDMLVENEEEVEDDEAEITEEEDIIDKGLNEEDDYDNKELDLDPEDNDVVYNSDW
ncbi:hypothetical protein K435DRAFT_804863 [Dendrothele bispora CBS 962.96]|uniref:Uncharacterized protein n=1 Tax=Dendrothele bispora (strain CBS 962.96) TaxID=1314807 RepID=A0A4S8LDL4_DENBC|nr:hypothetical protein K435DRAFT_804863 [Dendrothele bispora CBS 962.96]